MRVLNKMVTVVALKATLVVAGRETEIKTGNDHRSFDVNEPNLNASVLLSVSTYSRRQFFIHCHNI